MRSLTCCRLGETCGKIRGPTRQELISLREIGAGGLLNASDIWGRDKRGAKPRGAASVHVGPGIRAGRWLH